MYGCDNLLNIVVDKQNPKYKDINGVLFSIDGKNLIGFRIGRIGRYSIPMGTKKLNNCSFKYSHLSELEIPDSLEEIGSNVFYHCQFLKEIIVPDTIRKIEMNHNEGLRPISQRFNFKSDCLKLHPYSIEEMIEKIHEKK